MRAWIVNIIFLLSVIAIEAAIVLWALRLDLPAILAILGTLALADGFLLREILKVVEEEQQRIEYAVKRGIKTILGDLPGWASAARVRGEPEKAEAYEHVLDHALKEGKHSIYFYLREKHLI